MHVFTSAFHWKFDAVLQPYLSCLVFFYLFFLPVAFVNGFKINRSLFILQDVLKFRARHILTLLKSHRCFLNSFSNNQMGCKAAHLLVTARQSALFLKVL